MPAKLLSVREGDVSKPYFETMAPGESVCFTYTVNSAGLVPSEVVTVLVTANAHLVDDNIAENDFGMVVGKSHSSVMVNTTIGAAGTFDPDASPDSILSDLLPEYAA